MNKQIILIYILVLPIIGFSQKQIDVNNNSWWNYSGTHKLTNKVSLFTLYSWRRNDFVKNWQQSLVRVGVSYKLSDNFTITPGYDWVVTFPYGKQPTAVQFTEHRIFEQFVLKNKVNRIYFTHRYRFEQRFLENASLGLDNQKITDGYRLRQRARYRLTITIPLNHKTMEDNTIFLTVFDEVFINFGKGTANNSLDQNWVSAALGWKFNSKMNVKLGYQNQFIIKSNGINMERNHTFTVAIGYNFDFSKQ